MKKTFPGRFLALVAATLVSALGAASIAVAADLKPEQQALFDIYKELVEINTSDSVGDNTAAVPLVSVKPIYGHLLGASSALNVAAAALMLREDYIVPTANVDESLVAPGMNHQARGAHQSCELGIAFTAGLGGQSAAILLAKAPRGAQPRATGHSA